MAHLFKIYLVQFLVEFFKMVCITSMIDCTELNKLTYSEAITKNFILYYWMYNLNCLKFWCLGDAELDSSD